MRIIKVKRPPQPAPKPKRPRKPILQERAEQLVINATKSELKLKQALENEGYEFHFQYPHTGSILDFYFPTQGRIVELDGKNFHDRKKDAVRDAKFFVQGLLTLRIPSADVFTKMDKVMAQIDRFVPRHKKGPTIPSKSKKRKRRREYLALRKAVMGY